MNKRLAYSITATVIIGLGIIVSVRTGEWHWFARSGSLLVLQAVLIFTTPLELSRAARRFEVVLLIIGTLIWGFGDLIGKLNSN